MGELCVNRGRGVGAVANLARQTESRLRAKTVVLHLRILPQGLRLSLESGPPNGSSDKPEVGPLTELGRVLKTGALTRDIGS